MRSSLLLLLLRLPLLSHCCCSCCGWLLPPLLLLPAASHFPRHECELEAAKHAAEMLGVSVRSLRKKDRVCTLAVEERLRAIQPLLQGKPPHDIEAANPETGFKMDAESSHLRLFRRTSRAVRAFMCAVVWAGFELWGDVQSCVSRLVRAIVCTASGRGCLHSGFGVAAHAGGKKHMLSRPPLGGEFPGISTS